MRALNSSCLLLPIIAYAARRLHDFTREKIFSVSYGVIRLEDIAIVASWFYRATA